MCRTPALPCLRIGCPDALFHSNTDRADADLIEIPFFATNVSPSFDWNYTTVPQAALDNRTIPYPRGFVLGGSSSISPCLSQCGSLLMTEVGYTDYMFYTRGSSDEFDYISNFTGDLGWSWENMFRYMLKVKY